jgi:ribonuclease G
MPHAKSNLSIWGKPTGLFEEYDVEEEIERATQQRLSLGSGVTLSFEQTEALLVVDVNSSSLTISKGKNSVALSSNLDAAKEIARQIRLRNYAGIIIIDFIQMNGAGDLHKVSGLLNDAFRNDPVHTHMVGMTELGLMQVTRKRGRKSLQNILSMSCPHCAGLGRQDTTITSLSKLIRALEIEITSRDGKAIKISAGKDLVHHLIQHKGRIESHLSRALVVTKNADLPDDDYVLD